ncbi:Uncharacterised protein [Halioglobus japonicus]|nr:Uncharacterised protein [Halioglobus japonicus]
MCTSLGYCDAAARASLSRALARQMDLSPLQAMSSAAARSAFHCWVNDAAAVVRNARGTVTPKV